MLIQKNWFYDLSNIIETEIIVAKWVTISIFDNGKKDRKIFLEENSILNFYSLTENENTPNIKFFQDEKNSNLEIKYLIFSKDFNKINTKIFAEILNNNCKTNVLVMSIVWENWQISIDWIIKINKNLKNLNCHLKEENIFLWNLAHIEAKPKLLVESNDVQASHSCKIERLDKNKMFYLKSRGFLENEVVSLLLEANVRTLFWDLKVVNNKFYRNLLKKLFLKI
jgi:Fe-S cluster assembly scaffold protein SufB